ncbi:DUF1552 domain-containing protein [Vibrio sp. NTOU-M3]|uniref:DUF1552 domain-containing protein n=1 Tax=Vibrio sp. NTOU-M3 TaxID=3234954 RepID=UPI00349F12CD
MPFLKSRRRFLQAAAGASVLAPLSLPGLTRVAQAATTGHAKTKVVFFVVPDGFATDSFHSGFNQGLWFPKMETPNAVDTGAFTLNEVSQELAAYKNQSLYLQGMILGEGNAGHGGWAEVLRDRAKSQTSIDVLLGQVMSGTDPSQRAIFAGPHATDSVNWYVSWNGANKRVPQGNPKLLFENIFGTAYSRTQTRTTANNGGTHLFDPINQDIQTLRSKLSGRERQKLDTHLDSMEQVISDMENTIPVTAECRPVMPENNPIMSPDFRNQVQASHHQVVATALSCGISRVATVQVGRSADQVVIKDASTNANPHDLAHRYKSEAEWKASRKWYARQAKLFLDELSRHADPDVPSDSLLDHTLVVITSEMSDGAPEHQYNMPMLMVGGASGLLNNGSGQGRYYNIAQHGDRNHWAAGKQVDMQRIWATVAQAVGGTTVPYGGNISTVPGIFNNIT